MVSMAMSEMVCNCSKLLCDSCDIRNNSDISDSSNSSDSRQEETFLKEFATVCIHNICFLVFGVS